ncbi:hypothetical protein K9L27_00020 [Candidatus Gracilibacteria bacterium]|nr:hypothetical protein [Candidatus Gracilibacteria bacterium]
MIAWLLVPAGVLIIIYSEKIGVLTGEIPFGEKIFGAGGTYTLIKIVGLLMSLFSIMWITGGLPEFLHGMLSKFIPGVN